MSRLNVNLFGPPKHAEGKHQQSNVRCDFFATHQENCLYLYGETGCAEFECDEQMDLLFHKQHGNRCSECTPLANQHRTVSLAGMAEQAPINVNRHNWLMDGLNGMFADTSVLLRAPTVCFVACSACQMGCLLQTT